MLMSGQHAASVGNYIQVYDVKYTESVFMCILHMYMYLCMCMYMCMYIYQVECIEISRAGSMGTKHKEFLDSGHNKEYAERRRVCIA